MQTLFMNTLLLLSEQCCWSDVDRITNYLPVTQIPVNFPLIVAFIC